MASSIDVYVRWRPLENSEKTSGEATCHTIPSADASSRVAIEINRMTLPNDKTWKSPPAFKDVLKPEYDNAKSYNSVVAPAVPMVLGGGSFSVFAYGHSGSGKTHTIIGYGEEYGLCLKAAEQLFETMEAINKQSASETLGIGFSLFELRKKAAFDLLNNGTECHVREGYDGKTHIRGETKILEGGKVRVCPIVQRPCWTFESFKQELSLAISRRAVGSSSVHDQSSRTHAVLELEIVNEQLIGARQAVIDRQSELVPVGKRATDISIEEQTKSVIRTPDGKWAPNPDRPINQERIDAAEAEKSIYEERVASAENMVDTVIRSASSKCLGGKMIFVDLAGAEYQQDKNIHLPKQTPQERQEGRQINTDLLALKEVIRAWSKGEARIPFRSSTLTMVLREHFDNAAQGSSAMIVTVSPGKDQYAATLNSLKYGSLVGAVGS